jgi:CRISPR type IV-associated protein Csf3
MRNFRIEALLISPVIIYEPLHLDSLLSYAKNIIQGRREIPQRMEDATIFDDLPLARVNDVWCSSAGFVVGRDSKEIIHKKFEYAYENLIDFEGKREVIFTGGLYFKNNARPLIVTTAEKIIWFAVGNQSEVKKMLDTVIQIGRGRAVGYGAIKEWRYYGIAKDKSFFSGNKAMRKIPIEMAHCITSKIERCGYKPPYWDRSTYKPCYVPIWKHREPKEFEAYTEEYFCLSEESEIA